MVTGMADCFQRNSRIALAAPAVVLFVVTCLASLLSPPAPEEFGGDAKARDGLGPMRLRHGHHSHRGYRHENSGDEPDGGGGGGGGDSSPYDFYVYSMTFQPEFCRVGAGVDFELLSNSLTFFECRNPQLTGAE